MPCKEYRTSWSSYENKPDFGTDTFSLFDSSWQLPRGLWNPLSNPVSQKEILTVTNVLQLRGPMKLYINRLNTFVKPTWKTEGSCKRHFFPQMYWVSTFTAATFASCLNTRKHRLLYQGYTGCHKWAAGCCSGKTIFAFQANLLPLLIPSGLTEMMQMPQTFHEQLTVAFHLRFLMSDSELHGTFNVSIPKAHTYSLKSLTDFMSNLDCCEFF